MSFETIRQTLPSALAEAVSGYDWQPNYTGMTCVKVFRLVAQNKKPLYLKINSFDPRSSLLEEKLRLDWLKDQLPVPVSLYYTEEEDGEYFLLSEIPGVSAIDDSLKTDIPRLIAELVRGLKMIHEVPIKICPFDMRLNYKIETARLRMLKGLVEKEDFDEERRGKTARKLFKEVLAAKPSDEDLVFTHGDYCVPNIILQNGKLSGFVDWADAGIADRYQDLALLSRSVIHNFGEEYEESVFENYGIQPDRKKIHFYRLLDEFF